MSETETVIEARPSHYIPTRIRARNVTIPLRVDSSGTTYVASDGRDPEQVKLVEYCKKSLQVFRIIR